MQRILITITVVIILGASVYAFAGRPAKNESNGRVESNTSALWPALSIEEYSRGANGIVVGKFFKKNPQIVETNGSMTNSFSFRVEKVLKGNLQPGQEIQLVESVLSTNNGQMNEEDQLVYSATKRQLLFLGTDERGRLGVYAGPYGQFQIDDNQIATDKNKKTSKLSDLENGIQQALKK